MSGAKEPTYDLHRQVEIKVRNRCSDADELLAMLGVLVDGVLQPDPAVQVTAPNQSQPKVGKRAQVERPDAMDARPKVSTAPEALRNLPPLPEPVKAVKAKPKSVRKHRATNPDRKPVPRKTYVGSPAQIAASQAAGRSRQAPCGRYGAYRRHLRNGEPVDEACAEAAREQSRARDRHRNRRPQKLQPCGSDAGYRRHIRRGTPVCQPCRDAHNLRNRELKSAKEAA